MELWRSACGCHTQRRIRFHTFPLPSPHVLVFLPRSGFMSVCSPLLPRKRCYTESCALPRLFAVASGEVVGATGGAARVCVYVVVVMGVAPPPPRPEAAGRQGEETVLRRARLRCSRMRPAQFSGLVTPTRVSTALCTPVFNLLVCHLTAQAFVRREEREVRADSALPILHVNVPPTPCTSTQP